MHSCHIIKNQYVNSLLFLLFVDKMYNHRTSFLETFNDRNQEFNLLPFPLGSESQDNQTMQKHPGKNVFPKINTDNEQEASDTFSDTLKKNSTYLLLKKDRVNVSNSFGYASKRKNEVQSRKKRLWRHFLFSSLKKN